MRLSMIRCFSLLIMMMVLVAFRALELFLECLFIRTGSLDDRLGKQCNHEGGVGHPKLSN
jgi:hypothetical protein